MIPFSQIPECADQGRVKKEEVKIPNAGAFGIFGDPLEIRTPDPLLKRQLLCLLS